MNSFRNIDYSNSLERVRCNGVRSELGHSGTLEVD